MWQIQEIIAWNSFYRLINIAITILLPFYFVMQKNSRGNWTSSPKNNVFFHLYFSLSSTILFISANRACLLNAHHFYRKIFLLTFMSVCWKKNFEILGSLSDDSITSQEFKHETSNDRVFQIYFHFDSYRVIVKNFHITEACISIAISYLFLNFLKKRYMNFNRKRIFDRKFCIISFQLRKLEHNVLI